MHLLVCPASIYSNQKNTSELHLALLYPNKSSLAWDKYSSLLCSQRGVQREKFLIWQINCILHRSDTWSTVQFWNTFGKGSSLISCSLNTSLGPIITLNKTLQQNFIMGIFALTPVTIAADQDSKPETNSTNWKSDKGLKSTFQLNTCLNSVV